MLTMHAIMIATIQIKAPELFTNLQSDWTCFKWSDAFVHKFLHKMMGWSKQWATKLHRNCLQIIKKFSQMPFFVRPSLFATMPYLQLFVSTLTRHRCLPAGHWVYLEWIWCKASLNCQTRREEGFYSPPNAGHLHGGNITVLPKLQGPLLCRIPGTGLLDASFEDKYILVHSRDHARSPWQYHCTIFWEDKVDLRACSAMKRGHGSNEFHLPYKEIETFPQF